MKKKVLFIGNRVHCFNVLIKDSDYEIVKTFSLAKSYLSDFIIENNLNAEFFDISDKEYILSQLFELEYDILVSNGCPFIIPATALKKQGKLLINTHPTFLPYLRGATPLNGVFYKKYNFIGATTHYIEDGVDSGNIIYQKKMTLTSDMDQGLIYYVSFSLEAEVFREALRLLNKYGFNYVGTKQNISKGSYFNRTPKKQRINLAKNSVDLVYRKVKSFGMKTQGCELFLQDKSYTIYDCEKIVSPYLIEKFKDVNVGEIALRYDDKFILKFHDGLLKITDFIVN